MPAPNSRHLRQGTTRSSASLALAACLLAAVSPSALAQTASSANDGLTGLAGVDNSAASPAGLGGAVAGGIGLRGSADGIDNQAAPDAPDGIPGTVPVAAPPSPTAMKPVQLTLPPLRGTAMPDSYPVPLPPLEPYLRSLRLRKGSGDETDVAALPPPSPSTAMLPVVPRRTLPPDADPFGPVGYSLGSTRVFPYVEQSFGFDSNPEQVSTGIRSSAFSRTEGGLAIQSNWSASELRGTLHAGYDSFFQNHQADRPDGNGVVDLRVDATRDLSFDAEGRFTIDSQRSDSPELNVSVRDRPLITSVGTTVGATETFGRFSVGLHGLFDRTDYENGTLTDGTVVNLAYQNFNDYGVKLKLGYDLKPGLQPFVEVGYDRRIHDDTVDIFGYRRDSDGIGARVGSTFELLPQLTGTASVGYASRSYDDARLRDLNGPTAAATIAWNATPLTTLTLLGSTAFNESTLPNSSGFVSRAVSLSLTHALFRYLTLTGSVGFEQDDYQGVSLTENTLTAALKAEYHLTRSIVLTGTLSHQQLKSTVSGYDYTQDIAMLGLRVQH